MGRSGVRGREAALPPVSPTVVHLLADAAARAGDRTALSFEGRSLTYAQYLRCVAGFAGELRDLGARGERVALILGNSLEMAVAMFAVQAAGAQAVPLNPIYTPRELRHILGDARPTALVYDHRSEAALGSLRDELAIPHAVTVGDPAGRRLDVWRDHTGIRLPEPLPTPDMLAALQYTGGTTGIPKGVNISHGQMAVNIGQREALLPTRPDEERVLCVMPLFHVYAIAMALHLSAYCRGVLVILPRYHPEVVLRALVDERITIFPGSPTIFSGLMAHEAFAGCDWSSLRICYSGAAPLPEETLRRWEAATGCAILEGYGQTEAGPVLSFNPQEGVRKPGSVGVPLPHTEIQIVDVGRGTHALPLGEMGEIRARGPQIMAGYRDRPAETAEALRDGWLYTGDIGMMDADGYLYIRERKKDMAIVGGYNVYPREVDEVLYSHPAVLEAAAVGVPDAYRGEAIVAFVVLRPGAHATADALLAHCRANLAAYKVPTTIQAVEALPKTTVGKIDKRALKGM